MTQLETASANRLTSLVSMSDSVSPTGSFGTSSPTFNLIQNKHLHHHQDPFAAPGLKNGGSHAHTDYFDDTSVPKTIELGHVSNEVDVDFKCDSAATRPNAFSSLQPSSHHLKLVTATSEADSISDVKVQVYYNGLIMVIYIRNTLRLEELYGLLRDICKFDDQQLFTVKWVDEEGDPCTLSSQMELDESLRLYYLNKESELVLHVFANIPERPGTQCTGEDRSIYRRGARRWRKSYLVNGHKYQAKRFARTALCKVNDTF